MSGILIKLEPWFGVTINAYEEPDIECLNVVVVWSDSDRTTEYFEPKPNDNDGSYKFLDKDGKWRSIYRNYYKFKQLLEETCK